MLLDEQIHLLHELAGAGDLRERVEAWTAPGYSTTRTGFPFPRSASTYLPCQSLSGEPPWK